jgi:uncharacterized protein (TIGR00251 family)
MMADGVRSVNGIEVRRREVGPGGGWGAQGLMMAAITVDGDDVLVAVKVVPGASRTRVAGMIGERVKVAVAAPPEKGKANAALCAYLAGLCGVRKRDVSVVSGETSPQKTVRIRGAKADAVARAVGVS